MTDVSIDDMVDKIKLTLVRKNKLPLTVMVLDEVQQYIGDTLARSKGVQDLQEQCCSRLGANVLFVATGQNALTGVPLLQKLTGRFPVKVELQDTDVEKVTREVLLKKKPSAEAPLGSLVESHAGEIERHLSSTKIAFTTRDRGLLVQDYPVLPVRRRFWERVLRAVDKAGTGAQLQNQLSIVEEAVQQTADWPLGNVVSGAFINDASVKSSALKTGVLLQEISETIAKQKQENDGELRYQICALIFLIGQLPHQGPADSGIRATAETLADLLVTDLNVSSADLRKKVPELLETLVACGAVMPVEDEYRMQTREGSEWNQAYLESMNKLLGDAAKLGGERSQLLKTQSSDVLKKFKLTHGESKVARDIALDFGSESPTTGGTTVPVWLRDGWEVEEKTVIDDARVAGDSAAVVYGFIPRRQAEELKRAIAGHYAATATIQTKGNPSTPEGIEARKAMETRQEQARQARDGIIAEILNETAIYIAGGGEPVGGTLLADKVHLAAKACLDRLYPEFHKADAPAKDWMKVVERSKKGDGDALAAVGHQADADKHPVCAAVRNFVGSGKKGTEIRKHFGAPPYGWPQDAVDAALIVMFNAGLLQARAGNEPVAKQKLDQKNIAATDFRVENITLTTAQLIAIRTLFKVVGLNVLPGQESANAAQFLEIMLKRAVAAGGAPPLPAKPDVAHLTDMANRVGNDRLKAIHDHQDRLTKEANDWQKRAELIREREPHWRMLKALLSHAGDLAVAADAQPEVDSIEQHRRLLGEPDSVPGLLDKLAQALREALNEAYAVCEQLQQEGQAMLATSATWRQLSLDQQTALSDQYELNVLPELAVGTTDEILQTLSATRLKEWKTLADAIPARFAQALGAGAKLLEPKAQRVKLTGGTIKNEEDLRGWLAATEERIRDKLKDGPVII
ncbi:MAG TPA: BREX system P-loop protein BrxC [Pirellulales bacterium]|nr:BREX system P-loop protein BrxC [Pirellulales bacterium]